MGRVPSPKRTVAGALAVAALGSGIALIAGVGGASATTGTPEGLPEPKQVVAEKTGGAFLGRFFVSTVARKAHVKGGVLDIAFWVEAENPFFYGTMQLEAFSGGKPTTLLLQVYSFEYSHERLSANLIEPRSYSPTNPYGVSLGRISFADPKRIQGVATRAKDIARITGGKLTLNGQGPYQITFSRTSNDGFVSHIPSAKLTGG